MDRDILEGIRLMPLSEESAQAYEEFEAFLKKLAIVRDVIDEGDVITSYALIGAAQSFDQEDVNATRYFLLYPGGSIQPHVLLGLLHKALEYAADTEDVE